MKSFKDNNFFVLLSTCLFFSSCSSDKLIKFQQLNTFRVLAITASQPEVVASGSSNLTVYVSDPNGGGRSLTLDVEACIDPGISYGANPSCEGNPTQATLVSSSVRAAPGVAPHYVGALGAAIPVSVPSSAIIFAGRNSNTQNNGVSYLVIFRLTTPTGEKLTSFKRIVVSTRSIPNSNPVIQDILIDGVTESSQSMPTSKAKFEVTSAGIAQETYDEYDTTGALQTRKEELSVVWFSSQGLFTNAKTDSNQSNSYTPAETPVASTAFVMILKDNRGGSAINIFQK